MIGDIHSGSHEIADGHEQMFFYLPARSHSVFYLFVIFSVAKEVVRSSVDRRVGEACRPLDPLAGQRTTRACGCGVRDVFPRCLSLESKRRCFAPLMPW